MSGENWAKVTPGDLDRILEEYNRQEKDGLVEDLEFLERQKYSSFPALHQDYSAGIDNTPAPVVDIEPLYQAGLRLVEMGFGVKLSVDLPKVETPEKAG